MPRILGKSRIDVWKPKLKQVNSTTGANENVSYETDAPDRWVTLETHDSLITNQKRANALVGLSISDTLYNPRKATIRITNRCNDYKTLYDNSTTTTIANTTYTHVYNDSDGNDAAGGGRKLPRNWGLYTNFFYPFQFIRVVDIETNLVLFSGRIHKIDKRYEDGQGSVVVLECKDALEELAMFSCKQIGKNFRFLATSTRSRIITFGLKLIYEYNAANVKPAGGPEKSQLTPTTSHVPATFNITDWDYSTGDTANSYSRYEYSATELGHPVDWRLTDTGSKSILGEFIRFAVAEPHENETADDQFGYDLFVDSNIGSSNLSATVGPPAAQLNYVKRGNRLAKPDGSNSTQAPETYGLTVHFPITKAEIAQGHKTDSSGVQVAKKLMQRAFSFYNPNDEMFTHGILTYNAVEDDVEVDDNGLETPYKKKVEKAKQFEVIWVNHVNGQYEYKGLNIDDEWKKSTNDTPGVDSAETLDAYNLALDGTIGTKQADDVARIQYQSNPGNPSTTADYHYLMLSDITGDFPTSNYGSDAYVMLKGSTSEKTCRFYAESDNAQQGRPSTAWDITKKFNIVQMNITHPDDLRVNMASKLAQASSEIRRGTYQISKPPYYWYDAKVSSVGSTGGVGQRVVIKNVTGSSVIKITEFGFREGMLVHKMNSDFSAIAQVNSKDVYGYCFNMTDDTHMDIDLTESQAFSANDNIRLFIPIRTGDNIRVDNTLADVFGDHIVTETEYSEYMGPLTQLQSIGANEARQSGAVAKRTLWSAISKAPADERANTDIGNTPGNQFAKFDGTFSASAANEITWYGPGGAGTVGNLTTLDGINFQIVASTTSDTTHGLGSAGMTGTNKYVMYVDPDGENPATNSYHIKTLIYSSYLQDADKINIATCSVGDPLANMNGEQVKASGDGSPLKVDGPTLIHNESMTSALLKKGARPWVTDLQINGTAFNAISWSAATLTFANGDTVTINAGSATSIATGTHYMYLNGVSGSVTPLLTTTHGTAIGDAKILLATVTVSLATDGTKPTIFPFNGKYPTLSAVVLAADLIIADHIRTNTIGTDRLTVSARGEISEKTITTVSNSAPTSPTPRTGDIWFDTSGSITVIKVYDGSSWVLRNSNAPEGGGGNKITQITGSGTTPTSSTGSPQAAGDMVVNTTDFLQWTWDTNIGGSNKWRGIIAADAINNATTTIDGGFINTQKIVLNDGGASNTIFATGGVTGTANPPPSNPAARVEMDYTGIYGYSSSGTSNKQFYILSSNGKAYFGGGKIIADAEGLSINQVGASNNTGFLSFESSAGAKAKFYRMISAFGYPAHSQLYSAGTAAAAHVFVTTNTGAGFIHAGSATEHVTIGEDTDCNGFKAYYFSNGKNVSGTTQGVPPQTANDSGVLYIKSDGHLYWKGHSDGGSTIVEVKVSGSSAAVPDPLRLGKGTVSSPTYSFTLDNNTGIYSPSPDNSNAINFSCNSYARVQINASGINMLGNDNSSYIYGVHKIWLDNGASDDPSYTFTADTTSGLYYYSGVGMSISDLTKMKWESSTTWSYQRLKPTGPGIELGGSSHRWSTVYCASLNESSDVALKENMISLTKEKGLDFITSLNPIQYNMIDDSEIHTGFTAQHLKEKALAQGYTEDFGLYTEEIEEDGTVSWGLVYRDLIAPLVASIKELKDRIEVLEGN